MTTTFVLAVWMVTPAEAGFVGANKPYGVDNAGACVTSESLQWAVNHSVDGFVYVNDIDAETTETVITIANNPSIALVQATDANPCVRPAVPLAVNPVIQMIGANRLISVDQRDLVVDGITLTGGNTIENGGNIKIVGDPSTVYSLVLTGSTIIENGHADGEGGGVYAEDTYVVVDTGAAIQNNDADGNGGGIAVYRNPNIYVHMINNVDGNLSAAGDGGGVYASDASMCLWRTEDNEATFGNGGGAFFTGSLLPLYWTLGPMTANYAGLDGGATYLDGGLQYSQGEYTSNAANGDGGAFRVTNSTALALQRSTTIASNNAQGDGGALHADADSGVTAPFILGEGVDIVVEPVGTEIYYAIHTDGTCDDTLYTGLVTVSSNRAGWDGISLLTNAAGDGGGFFLTDATFDFDETVDDLLTWLTFDANEASDRGGAVALRSGAGFLATSAENAITATNNLADAGGGGAFDLADAVTLADIYAGTLDGNDALLGTGGAVTALGGSTFQMASGSLSTNIALTGGAVYAEGSTVRLGQASTSLGGAACPKPATYFTCVLISANKATNATVGGGGIATDGATASTVSVARALVLSNLSDLGSAVSVQGDNDVHTYTNVSLVGNLPNMMGNPYQIDVNGGANADLTCMQCTVAHGKKGVFDGAGTVHLTNTIVVQNPAGNIVGVAAANKICIQNGGVVTVNGPGASPQGKCVNKCAANVINQCGATGVRPDIENNPLVGDYDKGPFEQ